MDSKTENGCWFPYCNCEDDSCEASFSNYIASIPHQPDIRKQETRVFVFGSNTRGRHGAGAALRAVQGYGAIEGNGFGREGNSYAIPTKDYRLRPLPLDQITKQINTFIDYVKENPKMCFIVTRIGCGYAGFSDEQMAPLFKGLEGLNNVWFDSAWSRYIQTINTFTGEM